jgi:short-subunit dehydrogenase
MAANRVPEVVVITGATAGVGRASARLFAARGAKVALLSRGPDRLEATRQEIEASGADALAIPTDVSDAGQVEAAAARVEKDLGPIDIWINCAMTSVFSRVWDMLPEEYLRVTQVTYLGYVHGAQAALKRMRARNAGTIVQVGSALAYRGIPLQSAYCAAKHAIKGFTDSLRTELMNEKSNVKVTLVELPAVNTPQFSWVKSRLPRKAQPVPPIYQPEVPAKAIYIAAHSRRREWLLGWPTYRAIWGNKLAPGIADRYLAKTGVSSQQTSEPENPSRPDNLWSPPPGDYGCHGDFDSRARSGSPLLWLSRHRGKLTLAGLTLGTVAVGSWRAWKG